jgi:hypothetical protein
MRGILEDGLSGIFRELAIGERMKHRKESILLL